VSVGVSVCVIVGVCGVCRLRGGEADLADLADLDCDSSVAGAFF